MTPPSPRSPTDNDGGHVNLGFLELFDWNKLSGATVPSARA
jgi:hypothetical protein